MDESTEREYDSLNDNSGEHAIDRREYLKLAGTATALTAVAASQSTPVSAASTGYGEGGYGMGPYGGTSLFSVASAEATNVEPSSATLNGFLMSLEDADSADCAFEYRKTGTSNWSFASAQTLTDTGSFSADVTGLSEAMTYEFRAVATASDGDTDTSEIAQFTTGTSNAPPSIDSFTVTETRSTASEATITAEWTVSDSNGNLDTVLVRAFGSNNTIADASAVNISGETDTNSTTIDIESVEGQSFYVVLTVIDTYGQNVSQSKSVTE